MSSNERGKTAAILEGMEPPIYRQTFQYAMEHGERDAYFASRKAYERCCAAISDSIHTHFDGMHVDSRCIIEVLNKFSPERVRDVLACTVKLNDWDTRFSWKNRAWAKTIRTAHMGRDQERFAVAGHPVIVDDFVSLLRREVLEQSQGKKSTEKSSYKPPERSDDFEL